MSILTEGSAKIRVVTDRDDMLRQIVEDGKKKVEDLKIYLGREEEKLKLVDHMAETMRHAITVNKEALTEYQRFNPIHYAFTAEPENEDVGDCIEWLKDHPEVAEEFA
jgi:hypothetical protein